MASTSTTRPGREAIERELDTHRRELTAYCYRMLGSGFEAEDAVQETLVRAWRAADRFEGRAAIRSWLYRIATNVCLDMLRGPQRRARPMDLGPASTADAALDAGLPESAWVQPVRDDRVLPTAGDPADVATARETVRLAFVAALQHLPPKQRAVLILREVLRWQASEVAELLGTSVASVNSALQRARATLDSVDVTAPSTPPTDDRARELIARYVAAFEAYDVDTLVALLHDDATFSMPPYRLWLRGPVEVGRWLLGPGIGCKGSRVLTTSANGCAAVAQYRPAGPGRWEPWSFQVLEVDGDRLSAINNFLFPELFTGFGLPAYLEG
jgi:RNA polymerase sigma-70 factor (ECF subfamily)